MEPKSVRLQEFLRRLEAAPLAATHDEALQQLTVILNQVENEMTRIPYDPTKWETDGRLYPPLSDSIRPVPGRPDLTRYRVRQHNIYIGQNGAIEIRIAMGQGENRVVFRKAGANGLDIMLDDTSKLSD